MFYGILTLGERLAELEVMAHKNLIVPGARYAYYSSG